MLLKDLQTLATKLATGTLFHVEKAGKAYSVDYSALAKAIIEEYADSTVGGSKQSVQAAIAALNSRSTYKAGDSVTVSVNSIGRVVNARDGVYFSINLDRPINANGFNITFGNINIYVTDGETNMQLKTPFSVSTKQVNYNSIKMVVALSDTYTAPPVGCVAMLEIANATITFI